MCCRNVEERRISFYPACVFFGTRRYNTHTCDIFEKKRSNWGRRREQRTATACPQEDVGANRILNWIISRLSLTVMAVTIPTQRDASIFLSTQLSVCLYRSSSSFSISQSRDPIPFNFQPSTCNLTAFVYASSTCLWPSFPLFITPPFPECSNDRFNVRIKRFLNSTQFDVVSTCHSLTLVVLLYFRFSFPVSRAVFFSLKRRGKFLVLRFCFLRLKKETCRFSSKCEHRTKLRKLRKRWEKLKIKKRQSIFNAFEFRVFDQLFYNLGTHSLRVCQS